MARAVFVPPAELKRIVSEMKDRIKDWSVPMEKISGIMLEDTREVFADGLGEWAPMSPLTVERWGAHPLLVLMKSRVPLSKQNARSWSRSNAAVVNSAPHAHLMDSGTVRRSSPLYQSKKEGRRDSRAGEKAQRAGRSTSGSQHVPAREFLFVDEESYPKFETIILDYIEGAVSGDR